MPGPDCSPCPPPPPRPPGDGAASTPPPRPHGNFIDPGCSLESAERTSTQVTRRANRKKRLTVLYIVEHPNQEGDTCIEWTSQYCWTNGWDCLWRGHSVYRNRPLIPPRGSDLLVHRRGTRACAIGQVSATKLPTHRVGCPRTVGKRMPCGGPCSGPKCCVSPVESRPRRRQQCFTRRRSNVPLASGRETGSR